MDSVVRSPWERPEESMRSHRLPSTWSPFPGTPRPLPALRARGWNWKLVRRLRSMMCSVELAGRHINARARGPHAQAQAHSRRTRASRFLCTNRHRGTCQAGSLLSWGPARTRLALVDAVALRYLLRGLGLFDGRFQHILQPALPAPS